MNIMYYSPAITALVQAIKTTNLIPSRFMPLLSLALGVAIAIYDKSNPVEGLLLGASAVGLYEVVKGGAREIKSFQK